MKILYLMTNFPRWQGDVHSPWTVELIHRLNGRGAQVIVCAPSYRGLRDHAIEGIPVARYRYAPAAWETLTHESGAPNKIRRNPLYLALLPAYLLAGASRVRKLYHTEKPEVIHIHWPIPQSVLAWWGCRGQHVRQITTFYGADLALVRKYPFLAGILRAAVARSDVVTAISHFTGRELTRLTGIKPLIIPYGIDMAARQTVEPAKKPARYEILTVGRLIERKGHKVLIEAFAQLAQSRPDVALTIIGEGQERPNLERQIAACGLSGRVRLLGRVSDDELQRAYARCDLFAFPSIVDAAGDTEGLGMVLLEAMRYEKPVIASNLGGILDIVENDITGLLVPPGDAHALAVGMSRLLDDPALAERLGRAGRRINAERFAWERIVDAYMAIYRGDSPLALNEESLDRKNVALPDDSLEAGNVY